MKIEHECWMVWDDTGHRLAPLLVTGSGSRRKAMAVATEVFHEWATHGEWPASWRCLKTTISAEVEDE